MGMKEIHKKILATFLFFCLIAGITSVIVIYYKKGNDCDSNFIKCELNKDLIPGIYGYSYSFDCEKYTNRIKRTGLWSFEINDVDYEKTSFGSILIPTWSFIKNGTTGEIGYSISLKDKYEIIWGNIKWTSMRSYLPTTWPSGLKIVNMTNNVNNGIIVEFNKQSISLPKVKYTVCINSNVDSSFYDLIISTVGAFAIGKKD